MIRNPISEREFRTNLRKWQTFFVRSGYVIALIPPLLWVGFKQTELGAREAFMILAWIQLGTVVFLAPVFTAGTLSTERRRRTLGTLLLTDLTPSEIVSGTFYPRVAYLLMVILAAIPVLILWTIFGSIAWTEIVYGQVVILGVAVLGAAVGVFWSAITQKAIAALFCAYITMVFLLAAGPVANRLIVGWGIADSPLFIPNPVDVVSELFSLKTALSEKGASPWRWAACTILFLLPVIPLLRGASAFLHPFRYDRLRDRMKSLLGRDSGLFAWRHWRIPFLEQETAGRFANPIAWKELHAARWFGLRGAVLLTGVLVVLAVPFWIVLWDSWKVLWVHQVTIGVEIYFIALAATILSASSLAQERETLSLDVLLTTPVRPHTVIGGKLFALTLTFWVLLLLPFLHILFFTVLGRLNPATFLVFLGAIPITILFFVAQGLFFSTGIRTVLGAQATALVALHACLVLGLVGVTVLPHIWFLFLPASPFPFVLQGVRPGPAIENATSLVRLARADTFLLFLLCFPGGVITTMIVGKILSVLKDRFYHFIR
ncbi:MAG: hypothetical protein ACYTHM_08135 [Planctomycetota bacterium]|jgi:ABC-type transport system involved in multi-copper enzyme maturation permease subunit